VVSRREAFRCAVCDQQRADWQPVREALRQRDEVGLDSELLVGEERARPADARLDLVEAEQRAQLAGERLRARDER
jgi:outer membrane protein TolC